MATQLQDMANWNFYNPVNLSSKRNVTSTLEKSNQRQLHLEDQAFNPWAFVHWIGILPWSPSSHVSTVILDHSGSAQLYYWRHHHLYHRNIIIIIISLIRHPKTKGEV